MCTLLVVEDDPMISQLLSVMFGDDYTLLMADAGRRAFELARTEHPAAITLDLMLPDIHGRQILAELKSDPATADIPIIVLSAYARSLGEADRDRAVRVVSKPFSPVELLDVVREAVGGR